MCKSTPRSSISNHVPFLLAGAKPNPYPAHDHGHAVHAGHTHASGDCACSAPANDDFSDEELDLFSLYTPLRIVDELPASYGVGLRYLIEWEDLPLGGISVESVNGLGRESKRLLEEWRVRKAEIAKGEREAFNQEAWRKAMKEWNAKSQTEQAKVIEVLKAERIEKAT